jgi:transposase-like protein
MRLIHTAKTVPAAESYFDDFAREWDDTYPAMINSWRSAWEEFEPFLAFPVELRKVFYATNAIESLNSRFRRAVRHRVHFPNETAALKVLYLVATEHRQNRENLPGKDQRMENDPQHSEHPLRRPHQPARQPLAATVLTQEI